MQWNSLKTNIDSFDDVDDALRYNVECKILSGRSKKKKEEEENKCESFHSKRDEEKK